jgi:hypothetical protein
MARIAALSGEGSLSRDVTTGVGSGLGRAKTLVVCQVADFLQMYGGERGIRTPVTAFDRKPV